MKMFRKGQLMKRLCLAVGTLLIIPMMAMAQDDEGLDYSEMSLEDLLNVEVSVASTKVETIIETPAIVSRVNQADANRMGLRTLREMLEMIPGLIIDDATIGTSPVMIRGLSEGFNQKVLFLIDGVPYYQSSHSQIALLGMPSEAISHVEVIRGPGAVIYGTNASAGVINVVTKKPESKTIAVNAGSNSLVNGSAYLSHSWGEDTSFFASFETQSDDGYDAFYQNLNPAPPFFPDADTLPTSGFLNKREEMTSFLLGFNYKDLHVRYQQFEAERTGFASFTTTANKTVLEDEGSLIALDYTFNWEGGSAKLYTDINNFFLRLPTERSVGGVADGGFRFSDDGDDNKRWRTGVHVTHNINENFTIFGGAETEDREVGDYQIFRQSDDATLVTLMPGSEINETSFFGQIDVTRGKWRFLLGARFTDNEQSGSKTTPRASLVYKINDHQSIKALYSTGFNSPNFLQSGILLPNVIIGDPDLTAETVTAIDFAYSYNKDNTLFVANLFYMDGEDFIGREQRPPLLGAFYFNQEEAIERTGIDLDYQRAYTWGKVFTNLSYLDEGDNFDADDPWSIFSPTTNFALGANYKFMGNSSFGGSLRYVSDRGPADAQTLVNLNYEYKTERFEFYITGRNVTDEDQYSPDVQDFNVLRLVPKGDEFSYLAGAKLHF